MPCYAIDAGEHPVVSLKSFIFIRLRVLVVINCEDGAYIGYIAAMGK